MYAMVGEITTLTGVLGAGRLDSALAAALPQYSRARIQALISDAALRINGQIFADAGSKKMSGQKFELNIPAPVPDKAIAQDIALDIVFEDEHLIIVNKPAGLVVHPAAGHSDGTLVNALLTTAMASYPALAASNDLELSTVLIKTLQAFLWLQKAMPRMKASQGSSPRMTLNANISRL